MKKLFLSVAVLALLIAPAALAKTDALGLVPNDAVSVGVVKLAEMRTSPLSGALFQQTANVSMDADAIQFLRDAGLQPSKDVDVVVFSTSPRSTLGSEAEVLIAADGRFNVERLGAALVTRGAVKKSSPNAAYYMLPENARHGDSKDGAVAFPDGHLALIGTESAVLEALASRATGGTSFFSASGLGRDLSRVDVKATAWVLIDVTRAQRIVGAPKMKTDSAPGMAISSALKSVSTVALWATDTGDAIKLGAFGMARDTETLELLEDTLRGALSAMRLAVQDKSPELVSTLRRFTVSRSEDSVTINGSVPSETFKTWAAKREKKEASK
jgi:hypothetical protein